MTDHKIVRPLPVMAYIRMLIIGIGYLFPISAIWAAFDYWKMLFPDRNVEFIVTMIYQSVCLFTVGILSMRDGMDMEKRIFGGFAGQFGSLLLIFLIPMLQLDESCTYFLLLGLVSLCAISTSFLDSSLLSFCSQYSPKMQEAMQIGIGCSTLVSLVYRDATKILLPHSLGQATNIYFILSLCTVVICLWAFTSLMRMPISLKVIKQMVGAEKLLEDHIEREKKKKGHVVNHSMRSRKSSGSLATSEIVAPKKSRKEIWNLVRMNEIVILFAFLLITWMFPALLCSFRPSANPPRWVHPLLEKSWYQIFILTVFSVCDSTARFLVRFRFGLYHGNIWIVLLMRFLYMPIVLLYATGYFTFEIGAFCVVIVLGFFNGYLGSQALIMINEIPELTAEDKQIVGSWSAFAVQSGLCFGSIFAFVTAYLFELD